MTRSHQRVHKVSTTAWFQPNGDGTSTPGVLLTIGRAEPLHLPTETARALADRLEADPRALGVPDVPVARVVTGLRKAAARMDHRAARPQRHATV